MGFRAQLIAVAGKDARAVQSEFGVNPTGQYEDIAESPFVGAPLPSGAYLVYVNNPDRIVPDDKVYALLSRGASLIACYVNETVMNSYACGWENGEMRWSVFHDCLQDIKHLEASGTLPPEFQTIRDRLMEEQEGGDGSTDFVFDVAVELFVALGGLRYDEDIPGAQSDPWELLEAQG